MEGIHNIKLLIHILLISSMISGRFGVQCICSFRVPINEIGNGTVTLSNEVSSPRLIIILYRIMSNFELIHMGGVETMKSLTADDDGLRKR